MHKIGENVNIFYYKGIYADFVEDRMIHLKKLTSIIVIGVMCAAIAACGKDDQQENNMVITPDNGSNNEQQTENETTSGTTQGTYRNDVSTADLEAAVAQTLGENYLPDVTLDTVEGLGITTDMYDEFSYKVPMISGHVDTLIIVKAKEDKVADVETKLNEYRDSVVNDLMQYPMNLTKIQCSRVTTIGNYVIFIQLGGSLGSDASDAAIAASEKELTDDEIARIEMEVIDEQNDLALDAIRSMLTQ